MGFSEQTSDIISQTAVLTVTSEDQNEHFIKSTEALVIMFPCVSETHGQPRLNIELE